MRFVLLALLTIAASPVWATPPVKVRWECFQTSRAPRVPENEVIALSFLSFVQGKRLPLAPFQPLLKSAASKDTDFGQCLNTFYFQLVQELTTACQTRLVHPARKAACVETIPGYLEPLRKRIAEASWKSRPLPHAVPYFELLPKGTPARRARPIQAKLAQARAQLSQPEICTNSSSLAKLNWDILLSREFVDEHLETALRQHSKSPGCQEHIFQHYLARMETRQRSDESCPEELRESCREVRKSSAALMTKLATLAPAQFYRPKTDQMRAILLNAAHCLEEQPNPAPVFEETLKQLVSANECIGVAPGEQTEVIQQRTQGRYLLGRDHQQKPPHFVAKLNLVFQPAKKEEDMRRIVAECYRRANRVLFQPDGSRLELKIMSKSEALSHGSIEKTITIQDSDERANDSNWPDVTPWLVSDSENCPTIIHETLHLLGLNDEYREKLKGYRIDPKTGEKKWEDKVKTPGYDCRILGPRDSVMHSQREAFKRAENDGDKLRPLLFPAQWRMITEPNCDNANGIYLKCASRAYKTSPLVGGTTECGPPPQECKLPGWLQ